MTQTVQEREWEKEQNKMRTVGRHRNEKYRNNSLYLLYDVLPVNSTKSLFDFWVESKYTLYSALSFDLISIKIPPPSTKQSTTLRVSFSYFFSTKRTIFTPRLRRYRLRFHNLQGIPSSPLYHRIFSRNSSVPSIPPSPSQTTPSPSTHSPLRFAERI